MREYSWKGKPGKKITKISQQNNMSYNESKLNKLVQIMDVDYIEENPYDAYKLIQWLYAELNHRYDVIQLQREELLLLKAMVETGK